MSALSALSAFPQTIPTFQYKAGSNTYTLVGHDPVAGASTTIPVVVVPIELSFASYKESSLDAAETIPALLRSPVFGTYPLGNQTATQYSDALLRASIPNAKDDWHTVLAQPDLLKGVRITIPPAYGYVLSSKKSGTLLAIADIEYVQRELFKQVPKQDGKLVIAVTKNTAFYTEGDATLCCSWGTHGTDSATGNSFVLASYLFHAPAVVQDQDVQPLTQQLAELIYDPLHDPLVRVENGADKIGNQFPRWQRPSTMRPGDQGRCGGSGIATAYFLLEPTDTNPKNNLPYSKAFIARHAEMRYHVQNVALLPWYLGSAQSARQFSFPDPDVLPQPAQACPTREMREQRQASVASATAPLPAAKSTNGHALIGYWTGSGRGNQPFPLRDVSPQWDIIIVSFATPDHSAPEGTLRFRPPHGIDPEDLKRDIAALKTHGKKVLISLGGGGEVYTLDQPDSVSIFTSCVSRIVKEYGFDGIDLDFETPSLVVVPGDTDFKHPTTPSTIHMIAGLRQLKDELGPSFMISLVPEGPQIPAGHMTYGGQFGSYLPIAYGIRDILSFMDVQDYNTPPVEGLDGEIYQAGTVDYHAAMTDLVLNGFSIGYDAGQMFPALPQNQVAAGFLTGDATPQIVDQAMRYLITGQQTSDTTYRIRQPSGYPEMLGAMFWNIDDDAKENYKFSNVIGPQLHNLPAGSTIHTARSSAQKSKAR